MDDCKSDFEYNPALVKLENSHNEKDEKLYMDEKSSDDYSKTNEKLINKKKVVATNEFREDMRPNTDFQVAGQFMEGTESPSTLKSQDQTHIAQLPKNLNLK